MDDQYSDSEGRDPIPAVAAKWTVSWTSQVTDPATDRNDRFLPQLVIVGAGFAGLEAAQKTFQPEFEKPARGRKNLSCNLSSRPRQSRAL